MTKLKLLLIIALLSLSACGQKGPLLVKPEPAQKSAPDDKEPE